MTDWKEWFEIMNIMHTEKLNGAIVEMMYQAFKARMIAEQSASYEEISKKGLGMYLSEQHLDLSQYVNADNIDKIIADRNKLFDVIAEAESEK